MNLKNLKNKITEKINKGSVKMFFRKQGIYVLIFLCVAAAGVTALLTWPKDQPAPDNMGDTGASLIDAPRLEDELAARVTPTPSPEATQTPVPEETQKPVTGRTSVKLKKPVEGQIINPFSGDELVSFPSLNMWATHNGIDIKAEKDTPVTAALGGTVSEVYTNESDGGVVVITHSEKSVTLYAGLSQMSVKVGDKVNAGQEIGKIGELPRELDLSYHLHFEYKVDNVCKDPAKYF